MCMITKIEKSSRIVLVKKKIKTFRQLCMVLSKSEKEILMMEE